MRVDFLEQTFCNFKAFSGKHQLPLDLPGVTFVCGENQVEPRLESNGASKSSLWDALCWCLYGKTPGGLRNPDVIPWNKKGPTSVKVCTQVNTKPHEICRSINPNRLLLDGKEVGQDAIDTLICGFELFTNTVLLAQGEDLFFDRVPTAKMVLFSDTLQLERWDLRSKAAAKATEDAEAVVQELQEEQRATTSALQELNDLLADVKTKADDWAAKARTAAREATKRVGLLQQQYDAKFSQLAGAQLREDGASTELKSLNSEAGKLREEISTVRTKIGIAEANAETVAEQIDDCRKELGLLMRAKVCPTCGQSVRPANLAQHKKHLEDKLRELQVIPRAVPAKLTNALTLLQQRLSSTASYIESFQAKADGAEAEVGRLQPEVAALKAQLDEQRRVAKAEATNPFTDQIAQLAKRKKELVEDIASLEKDTNTASQRVEQHKFWIKGFKDIKLQLIEDVLQELELVTNSMLEQVGLVDWQIRYDIERETKSGSVQRVLNVQINSPRSSGFVKWESWSGGERQRLRLIGALALADVLLAHAGVQTNLEILDEPAVYWSGHGVQELCAFLAERARDQSKSIYYTEHSAQQSAHFSQVLTVVRDEQGAYIAED
jgi:DNA repair exonuclease SbcCD ATPase subunit